jgi:hypothetical protein
LSDFLGREVSVWPRQPASDRDHYRRGLPDEADFEQELRQIFGRTSDEPLPDLTMFDPELMEFTSPLGRTSTPSRYTCSRPPRSSA